MVTVDEMYERLRNGYYTNHLPYGNNFSPERTAYQRMEAELFQKFANDALEAYGITGNPKAPKAFSLAWEDGHSAGKHEVFLVLSKYAELIK